MCVMDCFNWYQVLEWLKAATLIVFDDLVANFSKWLMLLETTEKNQRRI